MKRDMLDRSNKDKYRIWYYAITLLFIVIMFFIYRSTAPIAEYYEKKTEREQAQFLENQQTVQQANSDSHEIKKSHIQNTNAVQTSAPRLSVYDKVLIIGLCVVGVIIGILLFVAGADEIGAFIVALSVAALLITYFL